MVCKKKIKDVYKGTIYYIDNEFLEKYSHEDDRLSWAFAAVSGEIEVIAHAVCCGETFINQDAFETAKSFILKDNDIPFFITGAGGQGKTVLMMELAQYFSQQNYPVFWIPMERQMVSAESVRQLIELLDHEASIYGKKTLLMLDNPYANLDCVEIFYRELIYGHYNIQVIISERVSRLDYIFSDDEYRFALWSQGGYFLCVGEQSEFENFQWLQMYQVVPFHVEWRYKIINGICTKLIKQSSGEESIVGDILQMQKKLFVNNNISLVELIYQFIFWYNDKIGNSSGMRIMSKRIPLDWDEWENWLQERNIQKSSSSYAYIAALYLLKIPVSVETLARILNVPKHILEAELDNCLRNGYKEPVIYDYNSKTVAIKHDMIADLYFKFHPRQSVQNILENLIHLMNQEEIKKFFQKLFSKKVVMRKSEPVFHINIDQLILTFVGCRSALEKLDLSGQRPRFELVRVWNKQVNPDSKDMPFSCEVLSDKYGDHLPMMNELGKFYASQGRVEEAERTFRKALETDGSHLPTLNELGRFYVSQGRAEEAEETFRKALDLDGGYLPTLKELGRFYVSQGRDEEAEETFRKALEVDGSSLSALNELGRLYASQGRAEEAEETFWKALAVDGRHLPALNELGRLYASQGRAEEAEETFRKALEVDRSDLPVLNELGRLYASQGRLEEAEETFRKALEVDGSSLPVLNELGRLYASQGRQEEAEETFRKALEVDGSSLPVLNELGRIYKKQNKIMSALQVFEQIVSKTNDDIIALYEIAKIYKKMENVDKAIEYYSKIIKIAPNDSRAVVGLFYCYYDYGKQEEAHEVLMNHTELQKNKYFHKCVYLYEKMYKKKEDK